jgi:hypothetical protein
LATGVGAPPPQRARDPSQLLLQVDLQGFDDRLTVLLANRLAGVGRLTADGVLNPRQRGDAAQHFFGKGRGGGLMDVHELSPTVRPAKSQGYRSGVGLADVGLADEPFEATPTIDLARTNETRGFDT